MTICGLDCCRECERLSACGGCEKCGGHPFGGECVAADFIQKNGVDAFETFKRELISEINALGIPGLELDGLNLLSGSYVNLAYPLSNGETVKLLRDSDVYLGNQLEREGSDRCYGVVACSRFIIVSEYGPYGAEPELLLYRRR